jgi:hypothetical protein
MSRPSPVKVLDGRLVTYLALLSIAMFSLTAWVHLQPVVDECASLLNTLPPVQCSNDAIFHTLAIAGVIGSPVLMLVMWATGQRKAG